MNLAILENRTPDAVILHNRFLMHLAQIDSIDFSNIRSKVIEAYSDWSITYIEEIEKLYKYFLALCALYPNDSFSPTLEVDEFWHFHILDTKVYANDCRTYLGYFLHHVPNYGKSAPTSKSEFDRIAEIMQIHGSVADCLFSENTRCSRCGNCRTCRGN
jgi:hypothetical protein